MTCQRGEKRVAVVVVVLLTTLLRIASRPTLMESLPRVCSRTVLNSLLVCLFASVAPTRASTTWGGGGADNNWSTPGNWNDSIAVSNTTAVLFFSGGVRTTSTNDISNLQIGGIQFGATTTPIVLSGNQVSFSNGTSSDTTISFSNNPAASVTQTINFDMALAQNMSISARANGNIVINGNISVTGTAAGLITINGPGIVEFTGSNNYGGNTIRSGTLRLSGTSMHASSGAISIAPNGTTPEAGLDIYGTTQILSGGLFLGASVLSNSVASKVNIVDSLGGGSLVLGADVVYNAGASGGNNGMSTISASLNLGGANRNFNIGDSDQAAIDLLVSGVIANTTGTAGITKQGLGTMRLTGSNTYNGKTVIQGGILSINSIKNVNGGASALGAVTTVSDGTVDIGNGANSAALIYTGTGDTTDRVINLAGGLGGATLEQAGSGLLKFTSNLTATGANSKTLTLQGSTAGVGEIAGAIVDNSAANKTSLVKTGSGLWRLSGANTYTGSTQLKSGTLAVDGSLSKSSAITVGDAGNLSTVAVLGGSGTIGNVTVGATAGNTGATLSPHAGSSSTSLGTTLSAGSVAFADSSAHLALQIGRNLSGDVSDHLNVTSLTLNGADLQLSLLNTGYTIGEGDLFFLVINSGVAISGKFGSLNGVATDLSDGTAFSYLGQLFQITYHASYTGNSFSGGNDIALLTVPEPSTYELMLGVVGMLAFLRRMRKRPCSTMAKNMDEAKA